MDINKFDMTKNNERNSLDKKHLINEG